jgi:hypothetical protein
VALTQEDSLYLFDLALNIGVAHTPTVLHACWEFEHRTLVDFPPEVFLQHPKTVEVREIST